MEYIKSAAFQALTGITSTFVTPLISWLYSPMLVTLSGMTTDDKALQYWNAAYPMLFTPFGIVTSVRASQSSKALSPIVIY